MSVRTGFWLSRPSLLKSFWQHVRLAVRLLREPGVPLLSKMLPALTALYVISPLDFLPDVLPVVGQIDDVTILALGVEAFIRMSPGAAVQYHRAAIDQGRRYSPMPPSATVIDAEFRRS